MEHIGILQLRHQLQQNRCGGSPLAQLHSSSAGVGEAIGRFAPDTPYAASDIKALPMALAALRSRRHGFGKVAAGQLRRPLRCVAAQRKGPAAAAQQQPKSIDHTLMGVDPIGGRNHFLFRFYPSLPEALHHLPLRSAGIAKAEGIGKIGAKACSALFKKRQIHIRMGAAVIAVHQPRLGRGIQLRQQRLHSLVRITHDAGEVHDAGLRQRGAGTAANAAANEHIHPGGGEKLRQRAVTAAQSRHHQRVDDHLVFHIINLKLLGVTKVLEHLTVAAVVSYCNSHEFRSFIIIYMSV